MRGFLKVEIEKIIFKISNLVNDCYFYLYLNVE